MDLCAFQPQEAPGMDFFTQKSLWDRDGDTDRDRLQLRALLFVFHSRPPLLGMENKRLDRRQSTSLVRSKCRQYPAAAATLNGKVYTISWAGKVEPTQLS